jgi:hypothetical protein
VLSGEAISSFEITLDGVVVLFDGFFWRCSRAASPRDCAWLPDMSGPVKTEISTTILNFRMVLPLGRSPEGTSIHAMPEIAKSNVTSVYGQQRTDGTDEGGLLRGPVRTLAVPH